MIQHLYFPLLVMATVLAASIIPEARGHLIRNTSLPSSLPNPCHPNPCGLNAECSVRGQQLVCTCPIGYEGDLLNNCIKAECTKSTDCPGHLTCQRRRCIYPCSIPNICGINAECNVINHQPICSCRHNMVGDPFVRCRQIDPEELCSPSPCGPNTNCSVRIDHNGNHNPVCTCIDNYIGNPLSGCHLNCTSDSECPSRMACSNNRCVDPCADACGEGAICDVVQGQVICSCPDSYKGNPLTRCYQECSEHSNCSSDQACYEFQCVDPCDGVCGVGAECEVINHNPVCYCGVYMVGDPFVRCTHINQGGECDSNPCGIGADCTVSFNRNGIYDPVCTCPRGYIGNPLVYCQRGECLLNNDCPDSQGCYGYTCQDPCNTDLGPACGADADCTVRKHEPVCSCPPGYEGDSLQSCHQESNSN